MTIRIANAAGFWGDDPDAPRRLLAAAEIDYLTLEYLAELTMSILAHQRSKNPRAGYATDFLAVLREIRPYLHQQPRLRIVTNAGGVNPRAAAEDAARVLGEAGDHQTLIAVVDGDDLLPRWDEWRATCEFRHLDTGEALPATCRPQCANAYLGAAPIAEALAAGARIVITGRVADASLTVGPAMFEYGWSWDDWDRIAAATVAGHLIECGAQVTGGYSDRWRDLDYLDIGYPIAEIEPDGTSVITKPLGSGGVVDRRSVIEQLVYEIGDPAAYITPDVVADFTTVEVDAAGPERVRIHHATGAAAPADYKVSLAYPAGYTASALLLVHGEDAEAKARFAGDLVLRRLAHRGFDFQKSLVEVLGAGDGVPGMGVAGNSPANVAREVVLRVTVQDPRREAVERFTREIAPLITNGPSGLAGYAAGRPVVRPVLAYWPTLIPKPLLAPLVDVRPAEQWLEKPS